MATPNHGCTSLTRRAAVSRSSTSRARARRSRVFVPEVVIGVTAFLPSGREPGSRHAPRTTVAAPTAIRSGARGSAKVAVPTPTASAPASIISTASTPVVTPPVPMIGVSGSARDTSQTARNAIALIGGPLRPPPPAPSFGRRVSGSTASPITVFTSVRPVAPASTARLAIATRSVTLGESFANSGVASPIASDNRTDRGMRRVRRMREHVTAILDVRARQVHFDRDDAIGDGLQRSCRGRVLLDAAAPDRRDHARAARFERGKVVRDPRVDARTRQADGVQHAAACGLGDAQRRIAAPRERGDRLRRDRADARGIAQLGELGAVAEGARGSNDRVGQRHGAEFDRGVDGCGGPAATH